MLLDLLRELGINFDPYAAYDEGPSGNDKLDPVTIACCADTRAMLTSAKRNSLPTDICGNLSILVHGMGSILRASISALKLGGPKTKDLFAAQVLTLSEPNTSGHSILRETRSHKIVFCPIFLISKGSGVARFIFDGRRLNEAAAPPPPVALPNMQDLLKRLTMNEASNQHSFILFDYRHWFHQLILPPDVVDKLGVKLRDPVSKKMRYFAYQTLPMGFSWSPAIAEACAWTTVLHRLDHEQALFKWDAACERIPSFVPCIDGEEKEIGFCTVMYDNIIIALNDGDVKTARKYAQRMMSNCKNFGVVIKEGAMFIPKEKGMDRYALIDECEPVKPKRARSGVVLPTDEELPCILGVEFESSKEFPLRWRHTEKRVTAAKQYLAELDKISWTPREISSRVGLIVWHYVVQRKRLGRIALLFEPLKRFDITTKADWDKVTDAPSEEWQKVVDEELRSIKSNQWNIKNPKRHGQLILGASDASDTLLAGMYFDDDANPIAVFQQSCRKEIHIFVKEALAAQRLLCFLIEAASAGSCIRILLDNTACRRAYERGYSSNSEVNKLICRVWTKAEEKNIDLEFIDVDTAVNVADCLTLDTTKRLTEHRHSGDGFFCPHRVFASREVLLLRRKGRVATQPHGGSPVSSSQLAFVENDIQIELEEGEDWLEQFSKQVLLDDEQEYESDEEEE